MFNLPKLITPADVARHAAEDEALAVRIIYRNVQNLRPFRMHGKSTHRYLLYHDRETNSHVIDIPVSLWMRDGGRVAEDVLGKKHRVPVRVHVVPWVPHETSKLANRHEPSPLPKKPPEEDGPTPDEKAAAILDEP